MNDLLKLATLELERSLTASLPPLAADWWPKHVLNRLSFQQQRFAQERHQTTLRDFDFAALLRLLDQNWYELSSSASLPKEGRSWVKELQTDRTTGQSGRHLHGSVLGRSLQVPTAVG